MMSQVSEHENIQKVYKESAHTNHSLVYGDGSLDIGCHQY